MAGALNSRNPGTFFHVLPGQTISTTFPSAGGPLSVSTQWPGSDVVLNLTSPSGRVYDRAVDARGVQHQVGPTFESYQLDTSEPGTWTAALYGARVAPEGEETRLDVWNTPAANQRPVARYTQTVKGRTVTVDARTSSDTERWLPAARQRTPTPNRART